MTTAVSGSFTSPPRNSKQSSRVRATDLPGWVNVTRNRQEQGRGRFDVSMAWAFTHTCLDNCLHSAERHSSTPMLLSCWRTRWVRFPRAALQYFTIVLSWLHLEQTMYHENTRLGESSISRHKARSGGFGTFFRGVWSSNPTRDSMVTAALDRPSNGRNADFLQSCQD